MITISSTKKKTQNSTKTSIRQLTTIGAPVYEKSDAVVEAEKKLEKWEQSSPGEYESKYEKEIEELLNQILSRKDFSYDVTTDPLYNQYKELYISNGKKAMKDTVGNASALTGGYLNSYAVTAGNQAYTDYLNDLNYLALDIRDRAYEQYSDEGDKLIEDVTVLRNLEGDAYEKYLGELERYYQDGNYLLEKLTSMSDSDFESFLASVDIWESNRDYEFEKYKDALDREEFEQELAFKKAEAERDQKNKDREYKASQQAASRSRSGSSSGGKSKKTQTSSSNRYPTSYGEFCLRTGYSGIMTNTEFQASPTMKKTYKNYQEYLKEMFKKYS